MFTKETLLATLKSIKSADTADINAAETKAQIINALLFMPYMEKNIIYSFYIQGDKWERIAARNNVSVQQCKQIRIKALNALLCHLN